jgi:diguanylate cyclase (GGDEF)-like protein
VTRARSNELTRALERFPLAVLIIDAEASAVTINSAWIRLSGLDRASSVGGGWLDAVEPIDRRVLVDRLRAATAEGSGGAAEFRLVGPDGRRWTRWWWSPTTGWMVVCIADVEDDRAREASLWQRATHDPLTGLVNRTQLLDLVERSLQHRDRGSSPPAVIYADLNSFKEVNDRGGHRIGDDVLRAAAERMEGAIRPDDVIARIGGDEFAVLCENIHSYEEVESVAHRLRQAVDLLIEVNGHQTNVTVTTGVALARAGDSAETLIARADAAMYAYKSPHGRAAPIAPAVTEKLTETDVEQTMRETSEALADLERRLRGTWNAAAGASSVERDAMDRLVQAARLVAAAQQALDPRSVR